MAATLPRRGFLPAILLALGLSLSLGACAANDGDDAVATETYAFEKRDAAPGGTHLRVVAGNLTTGNLQSWDPGEGIRILKGLAADVAVIQEFNYGNNTDADYKAFVAAAFEPSFSYTVEDGVQIPNGVVSRYPILQHGVEDDPQVSNRSFVWARIDVPGDKDLWAVSLHFLTSSSQKRQAEATALVAKLRTLVPESDYLVIGGDLNTGSRTESCLRVLGGITRTTAPWPLDSRRNGNTSRARSKPYDWLIADPDLDARAVPVEIGGSSFPSGLVFDSREFPDLQAVQPAKRTDSGAASMQHMAVVRDFDLPN